MGLSIGQMVNNPDLNFMSMGEQLLGEEVHFTFM
jgi:hypothetical protein